MENNDIEKLVSDRIIQKPICFSIPETVSERVPVCKYLPFIRKQVTRIHDRQFEIAPPTLGKMQILSRLYLELDFDDVQLHINPMKEVMRLTETKIDIMCEIMAVATLNDKQSLLSAEKIAERARYFRWKCYPSDFATLILALLTQIDYSVFADSIRLTRQFSVNGAKDLIEEEQ